MRLSEVFIQHAGAAKAAFAPLGKELDVILTPLLDTAYLAWPSVRVSREAFVRHMAQRMPQAQPVEFLKSIHAPDLLLCCACIAGEKTAVAAFEKQYLIPVARYCSSRSSVPGVGEELEQSLRIRLFVAREEAPARIASYTGQVSLKVWLRVITSRLAIDMQKKDRHERALAGDVLALRTSVPDPEIAYLKKRYGKELDEAFRATLKSLPEREAVFLRLSYLDGMTMDAIGGLFNVSTRTVQRSIAWSRREMLGQTRKVLAARFKLSKTELDTLLGLVQSQLDVSVRGLFVPEKK